MIIPYQTRPTADSDAALTGSRANWYATRRRTAGDCDHAFWRCRNDRSDAGSGGDASSMRTPFMRLIRQRSTRAILAASRSVDDKASIPRPTIQETEPASSSAHDRTTKNSEPVISETSTLTSARQVRGEIGPSRTDQPICAVGAGWAGACVVGACVNGSSPTPPRYATTPPLNGG